MFKITMKQKKNVLYCLKNILSFLFRINEIKISIVLIVFNSVS